MNGEKKYRPTVTELDAKLLQFIWKFKVVTTSAIQAAFYPDSGNRSAYKRLIKLKRGKYIDEICDSKGKGWYWSLSKSGFDLISEHLPTLIEKGFKSDFINHDVYVAAAQYGYWIWDFPSEGALVTEQMLRRTRPQALPDWIPDVDLRRPDGYWRIKDGQTYWIFALEVELSMKGGDQYGAIAHNYRNMNDVDRILWIVETDSLIRRIRLAFSKVLNANEQKHNFVRLSEFDKYGWAANICAGPEAGKNIAYMLRHPRCQWGANGHPHPFLDARKKSIDPSVYRNPWKS